ncbi:HNH endonuclease [Vibrio navarrensis]|uniref:HNH endonuclease n=2 Tax=Vibrio navarrensis TaxID=29495 RepID=UPI001559B2DD|nr:HNH endonuclease [Vibrio cidicii]
MPIGKAQRRVLLEAHHFVRLVDHGKDKPENCASICQNCHRKLRNGKGREELTANLLTKIEEKESGL